MPNWCSCDLKVYGPKEEVERFLEYAKGQDKNGNVLLIDFNKFVPMPPELLAVESGSGEMAYRAKYGTDEEVASILSYPWVQQEVITDRAGLIQFLEQKPEFAGLADKYKANKDKYGHTTWYSWAVEHWGAKWNTDSSTRIDAYDGKRAIVHFDTAWSPPLPVIETAGEQFPKLRLALRYFECGMGFKGVFEVKGGKVVRDETSEYRGSRGG